MKAEWKNIDFEWPQTDFEVLVAVDDDVYLDIYREDADGNGYFDNVAGVTHWMDKPEPPT